MGDTRRVGQVAAEKLAFWAISPARSCCCVEESDTAREVLVGETEPPTFVS